MKILYAYVENFGKISKQSFDFRTSNPIVIKENNSWGKSTLANFIFSMFYGLPDLRGKDLNDRVRYDPWQGGNFGGLLEIEFEGREYTITRNFEKRTFEFSDNKLKKRVDIIKHHRLDLGGKNLGEILFGVTKSSFEKSLYIRQGDITFSHLEGGINEKLRNTINATDNRHSFEGAIDILKSAVEKISRPRGGGELNDILSNLRLTENSLNECSALESRIAGCQKELEHEKGMLNKAEERLAILEVQISTLNAKDALEIERKKQHGEKKELIDQNLRLLQKEQEDYVAKKTLTQLERIKVEEELILARRNKSRGFGFILLCILTLGVAAIGARKKKKAKEREIKKLIERANALDKQIEELFNEFEKNQKTQNDLMMQKDMIDQTSVSFVPDISIEEAKESKEKGERYVRETLKNISRLETNISNFEMKCEQKDELVGERLSLLAKRKELENKKILLEKTIDFLQKANDELANQYLSPLKNNVVSFLDKFDYKKLNFDFDVDSKLLLGEKNSLSLFKALDYYSFGIKEVLNLCIRMALVKLLFPTSPPPIILDDPFVNLDDEKLAVALNFVKELSKEYQIIYFTCHESRVFD
ncbi:MAG: hypothetical protein FWC11_00970 [Firmicutes bacterium]|nr:hypothetical protein [Bacillota bacterium]